VRLRQRSASSGIMNGRALNEPELWDCGDVPEGQLLSSNPMRRRQAQQLS
jgi:hypothetical protein